MIAPDYIIITIIVVSVIIGIFRGMVKELITLVTWIVAVMLSVLYTNPLSQYVQITKHEFVHLLLAFLIIVVGTLFIGALLNYFIGNVLRKTPFSIPDRVLGSVFGFLRGVVLVTVLVLLGGLTPYPEEEWWQESPTISRFQVLAIWFKEHLPEKNAKAFHFPNEEESQDTIKEFKKNIRDEKIEIEDLVNDKKDHEEKDKKKKSPKHEEDDEDEDDE